MKRTREKGRGKRKAALIGLKRRKWRRKEIVLEKQYIIEKMDTSISGGEISSKKKKKPFLASGRIKRVRRRSNAAEVYTILHAVL